MRGALLCLLLFTTPAAAQLFGGVEEETPRCLECHREKKVGLSAIRDWSRSKHAENDVGCADCHLPVPGVPDEIANTRSRCEDPRVRRQVSPENCRDCHDEQVSQFEVGKHSLAWVAMNAIPMTQKLPKEILQRGCGNCHSIGFASGKCDSCHTRHLFSAAEARRPEACRTCHMGYDHPQWEMYSTSKHGSIYATEGYLWNWFQRLEEWFEKPLEARADQPRVPTCAFCHMPNGDHGVKTAWGFLAVRLAEKDPEWAAWRNTIFQGLGVIDKEGKPTPRFQVVLAGQVARLSREEWEDQRERVLRQCALCHARSYAESILEQADRVIREADRLMAEAVEIVEKLYEDGILPRPTDRPPTVDLLQFYEVETPIEQTLYEMFLKHRMRTYQGAFHLNPDYLHWYGWAQMKKDLAEIRTEARRLRREARK